MPFGVPAQNKLNFLLINLSATAIAGMICPPVPAAAIRIDLVLVSFGFDFIFIINSHQNPTRNKCY